MKKRDRIEKAIYNDTHLIKRIKSNMYSNQTTESAVDDFINGAQSWIKAIKENRMLCIVKSVSRSGMSRKFQYLSFNKIKNKGYYRTYALFLKHLGFKIVDYDCVVVQGCGMDMNFHTNYTIIHKLYSLKFITKQQKDKLCQQTPSIF